MPRPSLLPPPPLGRRGAPAPESPPAAPSLEREPLFDAKDGVFAAGVLLIVTGVAQMFVPAAWIVAGCALVFVAWRA